MREIKEPPLRAAISTLLSASVSSSHAGLPSIKPFTPIDPKPATTSPTKLNSPHYPSDFFLDKEEKDKLTSLSTATTSKRRQILPYAGAKSDGHLMNHSKNNPQQHAFIACNVIAAAAKKKQDLSSSNSNNNVYSRSSTAELQLPKVNSIES